ncbi:cytochrome P450 [Actinacidiphila alni]|uniref:cytochrome P450 n=1 Tax=Actinacidiphila alni TaxID=380248 RepID=UPI0033C87610
MQTPPDFQPPPPGCPAHDSGQSVPLYGPEFAAAPETYYSYMRQFGPSAPVELAPGVEAELVTDYTEALRVLQNPKTFARDSRRWNALNEGRIPADSPVVGMMAYRPNLLFSDGAEHMRLRQAATDSLAKVDSHRLGRHVDQVASYLIDQFGAKGRADLVADYAQQVPLLVFNDLFGCTEDIGNRLVFGISGIFDGIDVEKSQEVLIGALAELVELKRTNPGDDITSWMMQHPSALSTEEMIHQVFPMIAAGTEPVQNMISSALRLLLSDDKYADSQGMAGLLVEDALNDVLWNYPPMANYGVHYPVHDVDLAGITLKAGDPVVISYAAANTDPALVGNGRTMSKRAHLGWGAGPHVCPAKDPATLISLRAIEKLLNTLPDIDLAVPVESLTWRPGPFHRALTSLPARFTPARQAPRPAAQAAAAPAEAQAQAQAKPKAASRWSSFLNWLKA